MKDSRSLPLLLILLGCPDISDNAGNDAHGHHHKSSDGGIADAGNQEPENQVYEWGDIIDAPPETFFASDLSEEVRNGVNNGLQDAAEAWGNYGPLEYWVLGTDTDAG